MADGLPRAGIVVRALSESNFECARATTDRDGVARFASADLVPPKGKNGGEPAKTLVADTPEGPSVSTLDGEGFGGDADDMEFEEKPAHPPKGRVVRAVLLTDRSLYRPGQTVRMKGLVRTAPADGSGNGKLSLPAGEMVHWSVSRDEGGDPVAQGDAAVDDEGGWEASWPISTGAKLGDYRAVGTLKVPGQPDGNGGDEINGAASLHVQDYKVPLFEVKAGADPVAPSDSTGSACRVNAAYFSGEPVAGARVSWRVHWMRTDDGSVRHGGVTDADTPFDADEPMLSQDDLFSERAVSSPPDESAPPESKGETRLDARGAAEIHAPNCRRTCPARATRRVGKSP